MEDWTSRKQDQRVATNADQTEFTALQFGSCNLDAGTYDDRIAESLDDFEISPPFGVTQWAKRDISLDNASSDLATEIQRRRELLGTAYPFSLRNGTLVHNPSSSLVYEFCLAVSSATGLTSGAEAKLPVAFERLALEVCIKFMGPYTDGLRTGWPSDEFDTRPSKFKEMMGIVSQKFGEWVWRPEFSLPNDPPHQYVKDEGLDFVVCKSVPDNRGGKLFLLGQCACGNDFPTKYQEIDSDFAKLRKWFSPMSFVKAIRVFAVPRHIPNEPGFCEINREAGLTLDRARITLIAELNHKHFSDRAKIPYRDLIRIVIPGFDA